MPKRSDIESILVIGSGPIIIGQACEFDYSGTQALKALREEGYRTILVNSNPATIMTDPDLADRTYIEPLTPEFVEKIIEREKPDAILPTLGGQTGLNLVFNLAKRGVLEKHGVELIGASQEVIHRAEDRSAFKSIMDEIGLESARSGLAYTIEEAIAVRDEIGLPCVIRPAFTLGGSGGGIAYNNEEFIEIASRGLELSLVNEILIEESIFGWKEYELEVMRDHKDNVVIICSIENFDPMGVHTGDSITVAPAQTLTDREYQRMRDAALAIIRAIGVETGGSNIQFAIDPRTGRMIVIEMNPRVSRSSALASKATGFPIAKIAAKLAVGYTLDEIRNDITRETPACFEPSIDYCVVKIPKFAFEKFPEADATLTTQMKSVGEVMAIGRTFKEAFQKALRSMERNRGGFGLNRDDLWGTEAQPSRERIVEAISVPHDDRVDWLRYAIKAGIPADEIQELTQIDPWFLANLFEIVAMEEELARHASLEAVPEALLREAKRYGFADEQLARLFGRSELEVRAHRQALGVKPVYKLVDTCAGEFEAYTPYLYSSYEQEDESRPSDARKIIILGSGPNRIGQGVEFDYCCVHASYGMKDIGFETIMVNSNPETVSTDYDTSDRLYFEPLTFENVLDICENEKPHGVIVQFGGQTPLKLAKKLEAAGVPIIGTSPESIDIAEDRERFKKIVDELGIRQPPNGVAMTKEQALAVADEISYPILVRPSYVLGGRAMRICYVQSELDEYMSEAVSVSPEHPVLIDKFLEHAIEVDIDAICDGDRCVIGGIMEQLEQAGIHSGDSSCVIPPYSLSDSIVQRLGEMTRQLGMALDVRGLMNVQWAVRGEEIYIIEVNPRASRTVPFVSKAIGVLLAQIGAKVMGGMKLTELGFTEEVIPEHLTVKQPVFPFNKFAGTDIILSPEMRSTGESLGIDYDLGSAYGKAYEATGNALPLEGCVFVSVKDSDKREVIPLARQLVALGFEMVATKGTAKMLSRNGIPNRVVKKIAEGRPNITDHLKNGEIQLVINTPSGVGPRFDEAKIRRLTVTRGVSCITTLAAADAIVSAIAAKKERGIRVASIQEYLANTVRG
ncbi:MAG: carbamoyl-phosphate synthase large subunit [Planctomycetes bacterium]|nr:carbamoyl-phosphate synthase large subunit [Planctomycetota bacterium]